MASTFSPSLKLELIGDGDQSGIWGQTTNNNLGTLLEQAIAGVVTITMVDTNYTLTSFNGVSDEARNQVIVAVGTNSAQRNIIAPLVEKTYIIKNSTTGGFAVQIIGSSGTGVVIPNGVTTMVYCDGTNFFSAQSGTPGNLIVNGNLSVTGTTSLTGAMTGSTAVFSGAVSSVSPTFTGIPTAPTATVSTNTTQIATTAFVQSAFNASLSGIIVMWSGSIGSIPSGWRLCDGTGGTPDLRDRFIVGAGSTYAVNATGGSANATLVSHSHTASVSDPGHQHLFGGDDQIGSQAGYNAQSGFSYDAQSTGSGSAANYFTKRTDNTNNPQTTGITVGVSTEGSSATNANLPPYYALAYIMKT